MTQKGVLKSLKFLAIQSSNELLINEININILPKASVLFSYFLTEREEPHRVARVDTHWMHNATIHNGRGYVRGHESTRSYPDLGRVV